MNRYLNFDSSKSWAATNNPQISPVNIAKMTAPASTVFLCETYGGDYNAPDTSHDWSSPECDGWVQPNGALDYRTGQMNHTAQGLATGENTWTFTTSTGSYQVPAHLGGSVFLACDGHAKYLIGTKVSTGWASTNTNWAQAWGNSSGASVMTDGNGNPVTLTFGYI